MCQSPSFVWVKRGSKWEHTPVPCDRCWSCRENYINDWVGRCLCEAATSVATCVLSLTYAPPKDPRDLSHKVVNVHHFQLFMKRLRKAGHKVRYLVSGEYGELLGRAHFHVILFFSKLVDGDGKVCPKLEDRRAFAHDPSIAAPFMRQMPQKDMCHVREWPHGHVEADWSMSEEAVRYCCQYLYKDGKRTAWMSMSKKPPLGFEWFMRKAQRNVELGVMPSSFEYLPPGGKPGKVYLMTGATRREYLNAIVQDRSKRPRMSEWVAKTFDKLERAEFAAQRVAGFNDDAFLERQRSVAQVRSQIVWREGLERADADVMLERIAKAKGFSNVEEWDAFEAAGGFAANPYLRSPEREPGYVSDEPCSRHVAGRSCHCRGCQDLRARAAEIRARKPAPKRFDRQGRAVYGEPGREYLAGSFAREGNAAGTGSTLQADPAEE